MNDRALITVISGLGSKGPACFLVEGRGVRLLLDLGYGPQPGLLPDVDRVGKVDALVLSHGHQDHAGGLSLLEKVGNPPVYATAFVAHGLPQSIEKRLLPLQGGAEVLGVAVETGRAGHAPGGIWLRFDLGDGLLYMGDHCSGSLLWAYDAPPPAATIIIDASYGADDVAAIERFSRFDRLCASPGVLLPVPGDGRGPEIALYLRHKGCAALRLDDAVRSAFSSVATAGAQSLRDGLIGEIQHILTATVPITDDCGVMLASRADGSAGEAARLIARWEDMPAPEIIFTGYIPAGTAAQRLVQTGRAKYLRCNVHPRLSENAVLVRGIKPKTVVPAFCEREYAAALAAAFAPARVSFEPSIAL
jgi:Cft2 family RNA processing exonuclease